MANFLTSKYTLMLSDLKMYTKNPARVAYHCDHQGCSTAVRAVLADLVKFAQTNISLEEMTRYLTSVFKVMYETQPGTGERVGVTAEELARKTSPPARRRAIRRARAAGS